MASTCFALKCTDQFVIQIVAKLNSTPWRGFRELRSRNSLRVVSPPTSTARNYFRKSESLPVDDVLLPRWSEKKPAKKRLVILCQLFNLLFPHTPLRLDEIITHAKTK